jgi:HEAT repeat protein
MTRNRRRKSPTPSSDVTPRKHARRLPFEWPLLAFPVAVLAALVVLCVVDYSIKREMSASVTRRPAETAKAIAPAATERDTAASLAAEEGKPAPQITPDSGQQAAVASDMPLQPPVTQQAPEPGKRLPPVREEAGAPTRLAGLEGPDRTIVVLQDAIREKDQARIKQCIDNLVALGDQAIAPLTQVISNEGGEAGLWAAEALARIGTPLATTTLLDTLSQIKEGQYKEELGKRVAAISNHESWPVLLDHALQTADPTVLRAAGNSLSRMADTPVVDELLARYEIATEEGDIERIAQIIRNIDSSGATEALITLAGDVASAPQDALEQAAIEALGKIGDPQAVSYLMRKLEASPPGQGDYLFNTISQIKQPQAQDALLYAAAGNKEVSAENGRLAAIYALQNYPDARTYTLLEQIVAQEENERVSSAAVRTLDNIRRTSPHVVANAQSLEKKDPYAQPDMVKKEAPF